MKKSLLKKYARLIAETGAHVQPGQPVILWASAEQYDFATMVVEACYRRGASSVRVEWNHDPLNKLHYRYQTLERLSTVPKWQIEKQKDMVATLPCRIILLSDDPDGLNGVDVAKMQTARMAVSKKIKKYRDAIESRHQWTIAAAPGKAWAKKVFPDLRQGAAIEKLWEVILSTVMVDEATDPVANWDAHNRAFEARCRWLNDHHFDYVTYRSQNGTDFRADLIGRGVWRGGGEVTKAGVYFNPNLPSEEIFTSPMAGKAEGKLVATKPLVYYGQIIDRFWIRFENGRAVEWDAEQGKELLGRIIGMDDGAAKLGELALVPKNGPIDRCGILFYETLFDENASCHVALGCGFNDCIDGYLDMEDPNAECRALGVNDSVTHVDFMIGADDLAITGYKDGVATPIFLNGTWAF